MLLCPSDIQSKFNSYTLSRTITGLLTSMIDIIYASMDNEALSLTVILNRIL
jgi:hypothetical protein